MEQGQEKIGYREILTQREYCKIILANVVNRFGDSIDSITFTWLVYAITGSAAWSAVIYAFNMLPTIVVQPFAGAFVERRNKKTLMILGDIFRGIVVVMLAVVFLLEKASPWMLAVFTISISTAEAFCLPAVAAMVPIVLEKKYYEFGTSLNAVSGRIAELIGMAAAGVIIGCFGVETAILVDAATFFGSALIKTSLRVQEKEKTKKQKEHAANQYLSILREGLTYVAGKKPIRNICLVAFLINAMLIPVNSFLSPLVVDVLKGDSGLLSAIGVAMTVGMGIAGFCFPYLAKRMNASRLIVISGLGTSVCEAGLTAGSHFTEHTAVLYTVTMLAAFGTGWFIDLLSLAACVQFMKGVEQSYMARASALMNAGGALAMPLTAVIVSMLVKFVSVRVIIIASGVICGIIFVIVWAAKMPLEVTDEE